RGAEDFRTANCIWPKMFCGGSEVTGVGTSAGLEHHDAMLVSKNNAWLHGPARFNPPRFPDGLDSVEGLWPMPAVINLDVGQEVVLYLKDTTPFINTLAKTSPFNL